MSNKIIKEANRIAEELAGNEVFVTSVSGTILSELCNSVTNSPIMTEVGTEIVSGLTQDRLDGYEVDVEPGRVTKLKYYVDMVSEAVGKHLSFTRNTVSPVIKLLITSFERLVADHMDLDKKYTVKKYVTPEPLTDVGFLDALDVAYSVVPRMMLKALKNRISLSQDVDATTVVALLKTGSRTVDALIDNWITRVGTDLAIKVYRGVFTEIAGNMTYDSIMNGDNIDAVLMLHLFATNMFNNPPAGTTNYSLLEYNDIVGDWKSLTGYRLQNVMGMQDSAIKSGQLVVSKDINSVTVYPAVYDEYIEAGGTDIALLGTLLNSGFTYKTAILEAKDKLQNDFLAFGKMSNIENSLYLNDSNKKSMREALMQTISANWDKCYGYKYPTATTPNFDIPEYKAQVEVIKRVIADLPAGAFSDVPQLCTVLVCDIIYPDTGSKMILGGINAAVNKDKTLSIDEAVLLSTIEYVTDYVVDQIEVV